MLGFERAFVSCYSLQLERFCSISSKLSHSSFWNNIRAKAHWNGSLSLRAVSVVCQKQWVCGNLGLPGALLNDACTPIISVVYVSECICVCLCMSGGRIQEKVNQREGEDSEETWRAYRESSNSNRIPNVGILVIGTSNDALLNKACTSTAETTDDIHPVRCIRGILMNK